MRADLAALTHEAIAALSNWGLVKRALREPAPTLQEEPDGTVRGQFEDGATAMLPPGKSLAQGSCTCGATTVCRHRVAVALHYPRAEQAPWSPSEVTDEQLEEFLGRRLLDRARAALQRGLRAELSENAAHLPTCTVRFLVPRELAMARCDCAQKAGCEHIALAVWCFRHGGPVVEFAAETRRPETGHATRLSELLLERGVVHAGDLEAPFERARRELQGMTWPLILLQTLKEQLACYAQGSSRYHASEVAFALLSLRARLSHPKELSPSFVLGQDTALETELDHLRLVGLGCRVRDGIASVFLADPSGQVLVLEKPYTHPHANVAGDVRLSSLAGGQLVSKGVKRRANRSFTLRRERERHSVVPLGNAWEHLPGCLGQLHEDREPTRLLRPLALAEDFRVLAVDEVEVAYAPGEQAVLGSTDDVLIRRSFESACPGALDALARHLSEARQVSGFLSRRGGQWVLEPVALRTDERTISLDLEPEAPGWELPLVAGEAPEPGLSGLLREAWGVCEETVHFGQSQARRGLEQRREEVAERLASFGMPGLAGHLRAEPWYPAALRTYLALEL